MREIKTLKEWGINDLFARKIFRVYGEESLEAIGQNPYRLLADFPEVDFLEVDRLAAQLGLEPEDPRRIRSGVLFVLRKRGTDGSTCDLHRELTQESAEEILGVSFEEVEDEILAMEREGLLVTVSRQEELFVYDPSLYEAERNIAQGIGLLDRARVKPVLGDVDGLLARIQRDQNLVFSANQLETIRAVLKHNVAVITGGPGTGKTTIINGVISLLQSFHEKTVICAPTGRAAKRIKEATGHPAVTLHRLLEAELDEERHSVTFRRCQSNPLDVDGVIVDESSMLDVLLMSALMDALSPGTRLILVGDANQLPPVGPGHVLKDIMESQRVPVYALKEIYRQEKASRIVVNAHGIQGGEVPEEGKEPSDFRLVAAPTQQETLEGILAWMEGREWNGISFPMDPSEIQVITMTKQGPLGTRRLNEELQARLNPEAPEVPRLIDSRGRIFRRGDRVMQVRNNYQLTWKSLEDFTEGAGIFNGEIGIIHEIDVSRQRMGVVFDKNRYGFYPQELFHELELAYAITVHKSQGSEFPGIIMPLMWTTPKLANRNLLYTAVTRGRDQVALIGSLKLLESMVNNLSVDRRRTGLAWEIQEEIHVNPPKYEEIDK
jgi:exodeoxyribonuclease V alpha subunit